MKGRFQSQAASPRAHTLLPILGLLLILPLIVPAQQARLGGQGALVAQRNLAELVDAAGVIVVGTVLSARVQPHPDYPNIPTVLVSVQVDESLKGEVGGLYVYRQVILDVRERYNAAGYKKGERVLLLLARPSRYGLSSPMGLGQGRFRIAADAQGQQAAVNSFANAGLLREMRTELRQRGIDASAREAALVEQHTRGAVKLDDLKGLIRKLVARP